MKKKMYIWFNLKDRTAVVQKRELLSFHVGWWISSVTSSDLLSVKEHRCTIMEKEGVQKQDFGC